MPITPDHEIEAFIKAYAHELQNDSAAIFAGAGMSKAAGYVDWRELLADIAQAPTADGQVLAGQDGGLVAHRLKRLKITANKASEITMKVMPSTAADVAASPTPRAERFATEPR